MSKPAFFYVLSEPKPTLPLAEFHDWYDHEHIPLRTALPFFHSAVRYVASDSLKPSWLATYDLDSSSDLRDPAYTRLRDTRSEREANIIDHGVETLERQVYGQITYSGNPALDISSVGPVLVAVSISLPAENAAELKRWYLEEHIPLLAQIPGWARSRLFQQEDEKTGKPYPDPVFLALHDFESVNGLSGEEHKKATSTPWRTEVMKKVADVNRRTFVLYRSDEL